MSNIRLRRNARICDNNQLDDAVITAASQVGFPFSNALNFKQRGKIWKPTTKSFTIQIDMQANKQCSFFAMFGEVDKYLTISNEAVITLKANMINLFTGGEPFTKQATVTDKGVFCDLTDDENPTGQQFRFWRIIVEDSLNPADIEVSAIFLGDHIDFQFNAKQQFQFDRQDLTRRATSDAGVIYSIRKLQYAVFNAMGWSYLDTGDRTKLLSSVEKIGLSTPFVFVLDPLQIAFQYEFGNLLCYWEDIPKLTHAYLNKFNVAFAVREVV
jgi:hypothetical protein